MATKALSSSAGLRARRDAASVDERRVRRCAANTRARARAPESRPPFYGRNTKGGGLSPASLYLTNNSYKNTRRKCFVENPNGPR